MSKSTKSKTENENYWGYIIFAALILIYIPFGNAIWGGSNPASRTARTNNRPDKQIQTQENQTSNKLTSSTINYCSLSSNKLVKQLTNERHYTLNGYGYVRFSQRFDHGRNQWVENQIIISGNGKRLTGNWRLLSNNRISVSNLIATGGNFDASNNSKTRGILVVECNGNLKGTLAAPNGKTTDIQIQKSR